MLERPEGDRRHITWRIAVVAVLLLLLVGGIVRLVRLNNATDVYQDQSVLSARIASNAIRLGHDAQRYVIMDWKPNDTSPMWMFTYLNLRKNLESLVSDARRLPHAADTRQVLQDVVSSWDIVEAKVYDAQRNLDVLFGVPELVEELQGKSLLRAHHASWEYPHYLDPRRIFLLDRAVSAFTDLSLSAEVFGDVVARYRLASVTEASVVTQTRRTTIAFSAMVALVLLGIGLATGMQLVRQRAVDAGGTMQGPLPDESRPHDSSSDELERIIRFTAVPPTLEDNNEEFPHWLSSAIRAYQSLPHLDYGVDEFVQLAGRTPEYVSRTVKAWFGVTLTEFLRRERLARAVVMLRESDETIAAIALSIGFHSESYFYRSFREAFGLTPAQYRNLAAAKAMATPVARAGQEQTSVTSSVHRNVSA